MSNQSELTNGEGRNLAILLALFISGIGLMYLGRAVFFHHGSWLSGGIGGFAVLLGGGDAEAARRMTESVLRRQPTFTEQVLFWLGAFAILLNVVAIRTGVFTSSMERENE